MELEGIIHERSILSLFQGGGFPSSSINYQCRSSTVGNCIKLSLHSAGAWSPQAFSEVTSSAADPFGHAAITLAASYNLANFNISRGTLGIMTLGSSRERARQPGAMRYS
jgi:hypothetical protein